MMCRLCRHRILAVLFAFFYAAPASALTCCCCCCCCNADVDELPQPNNRKVRRKQLPGSYCAAARFAGLPFDWEVKDAERKLREALAKDGLRAKPGYSLARYNEPWVPPPLRRNEVLVELVGFEWP
jgi:hypothetical protein